jgi:hypothetical protein
MGTLIRPELSEKNKYWLDKHRYYELKHFCLQYPTWKKLYLSQDSLAKQSHDLAAVPSGRIGDPTADCVESKLLYSERLNLIEQAAIETDKELSSYILEAVTKGLSYTCLRTKLGIPCCRDIYYELYRRFFWLLNKTRN